MLRINLLPWRHYQHQFEKKIIRLWASVLSLLCLSIMLVAHHFLNAKSLRLQDQLRSMQESLSKLKTTSPTSDNFFSWTKILRRVDNNNHQLLFALMTLQAPGQMCLQEVTYAANKITFRGRAYSIVDAVNFLQQLKNKSLELDNLQTTSSNIFFRAHFSLSI